MPFEQKTWKIWNENHKHELHDRFYNATTTDFMPQTNRCCTVLQLSGVFYLSVWNRFRVMPSECLWTLYSVWCIRLVCKCSVVRNQSQHNGRYRGFIFWVVILGSLGAYVSKSCTVGCMLFLGKFKCLHVIIVPPRWNQIRYKIRLASIREDKYVACSILLHFFNVGF